MHSHQVVALDELQHPHAVDYQILNSDQISKEILTCTRKSGFCLTEREMELSESQYQVVYSRTLKSIPWPSSVTCSLTLLIMAKGYYDFRGSRMGQGYRDFRGFKSAQLCLICIGAFFCITSNQIKRIPCPIRIRGTQLEKPHLLICLTKTTYSWSLIFCA